MQGRICNPSAPTAEGEPEPPEACKPATLVCEEQRTTDSISSKVEDEGPHLQLTSDTWRAHTPTPT